LRSQEEGKEKLKRPCTLQRLKKGKREIQRPCHFEVVEKEYKEYPGRWPGGKKKLEVATRERVEASRTGWARSEEGKNTEPSAPSWPAREIGNLATL